MFEQNASLNENCVKLFDVFLGVRRDRGGGGRAISVAVFCVYMLMLLLVYCVFVFGQSGGSRSIGFASLGILRTEYFRRPVLPEICTVSRSFPPRPKFCLLPLALALPNCAVRLMLAPVPCGFMSVFDILITARFGLKGKSVVHL